MSYSSSRISRRDFVKMTTAFVSTVISAVVGLPVIGYLLSPAFGAEEKDDAAISLGPLENYPIGIPTPFSFTRTKVNGWEKTAIVIGMYVVRKGDGQVRVFSDICTHLGCLVTWHSDIQEFVSPCHDGHFDIDGFVTKGPPPRPMDEFQTRIEKGELYVLTPAYRRSA